MYDYASLQVFSFQAWCSLFYEFTVPSSFCHLWFIVVFCHFISFHFGMLFAFSFGCALVFFIHPLVLLCFPNFVYDCILLQFFSFGCGAVFFIHSLLLLLFVVCVSLQFFVILFPFVSVCCCLLGGSSFILFIHWYFFVFPPLCMIAFCRGCFFFWVWCFLFMSSLFLLFLVICLFRCMIAFYCGWLSFGHVVVFLIPPWFISSSNQKNCILLCLLDFSFSFRHTVVFFIPPSFNSFTESNEWCFIAVF